ncbi:sugar phosphate isomerase/epimerase family protein [Deinococcus sp. UYEF24]
MELKLVRHLWGLAEPLDRLLPQFTAAGYTAIENAAPAESEADSFREHMKASEMSFIAQVFTQGQTVEEHLDSFQQQLEYAAGFRPLFINSHSGLDRWSEAQADAFFAEALKMEEALGIRVAHETHRGRILYNPWTTDRLIGKFPALNLTLDLSHWVCVTERLLDGPELDIVKRCAERCLHLHARVGYEEGPQVLDPRAPEFAAQVRAHQDWWDLVWDAQERRGQAVSTLTPEYGPGLYLHALPYTQMPVADLASICDWQARKEAERFARRA